MIIQSTAMSLVLTLASRNLFQNRLRFVASLIGIEPMGMTSWRFSRQSQRNATAPFSWSPMIIDFSDMPTGYYTSKTVYSRAKSQLRLGRPSCAARVTNHDG
jgi:hypothetical protein